MLQCSDCTAGRKGGRAGGFELEKELMAWAAGGWSGSGYRVGCCVREIRVRDGRGRPMDSFLDLKRRRT